MASAAWPAIDRAASSTSPRSGRAGSRETSVSVASASAGVETGMTTALAPLSRKGTSSSCPASSCAERRSRTIGSPERSNRRTGGAVAGWSRPRIERSASSFGSETYTERVSSTSPRPSGSRIAAASIPSVSTIVRVTASSVASSERLWVNEWEISYCASRRIDREQPDYRLRRDQRDSQHPFDSRFGQLAAHAAEQLGCLPRRQDQRL